MTPLAPRRAYLLLAPSRSVVIGLAATAGLASSGAAWAQALHRSVFAANNGNLEGSVTSYRVNPDGTLVFRDKYVTGSRPNTQVFVPGTNAISVSVTPNGRFLAASHATSSTTTEQLTILAVNSDGTLALAGVFQTPDAPLHLQWITNSLLAVTRTSGPPNGVVVYRFDPSPPGGGAATLAQTDFQATGGFSTWIAVHPNRSVLYVQTTSGGNLVFPFVVNAGAGTLTSLTPWAAGAFPLGQGVSPDGRWLFAGGGISGSGRLVVGASVNPDFTLTTLAGSPFTSPGQSPKQVVVSSDSRFAFAAHGTDSTVRGFSIDQTTGLLTDIGVSFDVGAQGTLGDIATLNNLLLMADRDGRQVYSFTVSASGAIAQNGPPVASQGIATNGLATWAPICTGDANGDWLVNFADLNIVLGAFGQTVTPNTNGDVNGDGVVNFADLNIVLGSFGRVC